MYGVVSLLYTWIPINAEKVIICSVIKGTVRRYAGCTVDYKGSSKKFIGGRKHSIRLTCPCY